MDCSAMNSEQKLSFNEFVVIKSEPPDLDDLNEVKVTIESTQVKIEPSEELEGDEVPFKAETVDEDSKLLNDLNTSTAETVTIKVEPVNYDSDDERPIRPQMPRLAKNAAYKMYKEERVLGVDKVLDVPDNKVLDVAYKLLDVPDKVAKKPKKNKKKENVEKDDNMIKLRDQAYFWNEHNKNMFVCDQCGKGFKIKGRLRRHLLIHQLNVPCDICNLMFKNAGTLKRHHATEHKQIKKGPRKRNYKGQKKKKHCPHCDRVVTCKSMLARHILRMHMPKTRNFECDYCHRLYQTKAELREHIMWSHLRATGASNAGGHVCSCGRVFRSPSKLREHKRRKHLRQPTVKTHACDECGKAFETSAVLRRHKDVHTNETHPCTECGRKFRSRAYVTVHYKLKHLNMTRSQIRQQNQLNRSKDFLGCFSRVAKNIPNETKPDSAASLMNGCVDSSRKTDVSSDNGDSVARIKVENDSVNGSENISEECGPTMTFVDVHDILKNIKFKFLKIPNSIRNLS